MREYYAWVVMVGGKDPINSERGSFEQKLSYNNIQNVPNQKY